MPELIDAIRQAVRSGQAPRPDLRLALAQTEELGALLAAGRALAELVDPKAELTPIRVTLLSTCRPGPLEPLLRSCLVAAGALPELTVTPPALFDAALAGGGARSGAELLLCLLDEGYFLPADLDAATPAAAWPQLAERLARLRTLVAAGLRAGGATVVLHTVPLPRGLRDTVIGLRARGALTALWHRLNAGLLALGEEYPRVHVVDLVGLLAESPVQARTPRGRRIDRAGDSPYSSGALLLLAQEARRIAQAGSGLSRRVLAIDLDSALWGDWAPEPAPGEAAGPDRADPDEDGRAELRRTVGRLRDQGVLLVLVGGEGAGPLHEVPPHRPPAPPAPNAPDAPDTPGSADFAPAAERLRRAAQVLGLGTEAFVYLDDSEFERGAVAAELPEVAVVEPSGPTARLASALLRHGWFDVLEPTRPATGSMS